MVDGLRAFRHVGFFVFVRQNWWQPPEVRSMEQPTLTMAQQVAQAASAFQQQRTGHAPKAVTVVLSDNTLVITLHGVLSPAEEALAKSPAGTAQVTGLSPPVVRQFLRAACDKRSKESPESRCANRSPRSNRVPARWSKCSRAAPWCRCSCSPMASRRVPGTEMDPVTRDEPGGVAVPFLPGIRMGAGCETWPALT